MDKLEEAKQEVPLLDYILSNTGSRLEKEHNVSGKSAVWIKPCPICGKDAKMGDPNNHFYYVYNDNSWGAWCNGTGGTVIDFLMEYENLDRTEAIKKTKELAGVEEENPKLDFQSTTSNQNLGRGGKVEKQNKESAANTAPSKEELNKIINQSKPSDYFYSNRGLTDKTVKKYQLGKIPGGINKPGYPSEYELVIPAGDNGFILMGSENGANPKYKGYGKYDFLNRRYLEDPELTDQFVFVTEGVFDALSFEEFGYPAISLNGLNIKGLVEEIQKNRNKLKDKVIVIALDNDDQAKPKVEELASKIDTLNLDYEIFYYPQKYKDANEFLIDDRQAFEIHIENFINSLSGMVENYLPEFLKIMKKRESENPVETGIFELDNKLGGGIFPGLYTLGANTGGGKSAFALQVADEAAKNNQDVIFYSLEMSRYELICRSLSRLTYELNDGDLTKASNSKQIMRAELKGEKDEALREAYKYYDENIAGNLAIIEGNFGETFNDIYRKTKKIMKYRGSKPLLIIDYLQIIQNEDTRLSEKQNIDYNMTSIKRMSRELDLPVILISSLNRENYHKKINLAAFKESGNVEFSSDVVLGLQLEVMNEVEEMADNKKVEKKKKIDEAMKENPRSLELHILKYREGKTGEKVRLDYYPVNHLFEGKVI